MSCLHERYVIVPADKAATKIGFVFKSQYIDCLIKVLCIDSSFDNQPNRFNPATCLCLFQARTWISTSYVVVFFVFNELR
jgi:hypothetical protein